MTEYCEMCEHRDFFINKGEMWFYCELTMCILDKEGNGYRRCPLTIEQRDKLHANSEW